MLGSVQFIPKEALKNNAGQTSEEAAAQKRKDAGMEWMTRAPAPKKPEIQEEAPASSTIEVQETQVNPRELNPYLKDGGEGYKRGDSRKLPSGVGDGGASWRLKAMKRAQEQAAREGKHLDEIVSDRFGSLSSLASGIAGRRAAHANAHLHAIRDRKRKLEDEKDDGRPEASEDRRERGDERRERAEDRRDRGDNRRDRGDDRRDRGDDRRDRGDDRRERGEYGREKRERDKDSSYRFRTRAPQLQDSLRWKNRRSDGQQQMRPNDAALLKAAAAACNPYENDGSFMEKFKEQQRQKKEAVPEDEEDDGFTSTGDVPSEAKQGSNQVAAKAMKLRLMGKVKEADELLSKAASQDGGNQRAGSETLMRTIVAKQRHGDENKSFDDVLVSKIGRAREGYRPDEEYDDVGLETGPSKRRRPAKDAQRGGKAAVLQFNRLRTQQERCQFCFENPTRAKHLTVAIANFTYLMLPPTAPLVSGHCYIVPMQHDGSTRNADDIVWEELRNFKKCLIKMFKEEEQEVIFMETVMGLSQQRRHCLVECIPVPPEAMGQAPLYFKKAIDEVEDEWSQHNAKKLIDTRGKGLRSCIPKNFPYFHVEFGLEGGYCHVIDDEASFKPRFGVDVLIGLLKLPQERMHQRARKYASLEEQTAAVKEFSRQWQPHDWTQMLN